ncbi:MAG: hypothetical protein HXL34_01235 [Prevotellaceae bacterium]|nr:hypothetical protein [Prevotellaceae bacterium]
MSGGLQTKGYGSAAVSSVYGDRRTMCMTAVSNAADDRQTMNSIPQTFE